MPDTLYFYEHKSFGRWWPRTEPGMPTLRTSEGKRRNVRGIIEVDPRHAHLSLKTLFELYSIDGRFVGTQGPDHVRKVRGLSV